MSRALPPSPARVEPRPRENQIGNAAARDSAVSWDPLRSTDRYRYALVYDERSRSFVPALPPPAE
ncbi:MAG: hypothetical protein JNM84_17000 [Planctomycetes bacterium]|nr:hypothetical protein [Planctomycetota bacterium]